MSTRIPVIRKGMFCGDLDVATQDLILNTREATSKSPQNIPFLITGILVDIKVLLYISCHFY